MPESLEGRVAIITGASSGIGLTTAEALAGAGASVAVAARRADRLDALCRRIENAGGRAAGFPTDVTDRDAVEDLVSGTVAAFGTVHILVNNPGVMPISPLADVLVDDCVRMVNVNVIGVLHGIGAVLPVMLARGTGHIVNVGSLAGRRPFPGGTVYSATKFAVRSLSAGIQRELSASRGIRVTDIEPGVVDTELMDHITDAQVRDGFAQQWSDKTPLSPQDVAAAIVYAVTAPEHVNVNEILIRPRDQET